MLVELSIYQRLFRGAVKRISSLRMDKKNFGILRAHPPLVPMITM